MGRTKYNGGSCSPSRPFPPASRTILEKKRCIKSWCWLSPWYRDPTTHLTLSENVLERLREMRESRSKMEGEKGKIGGYRVTFDLFQYEGVRSPVKSIFAQSVLLIQLLRYRIPEGFGRHRRVEGSVENGDMRHIGEHILGHGNLQQMNSKVDEGDLML